MATPTDIATPTIQVLLYVSSQLIGENGRQQDSNNSLIQTTQQTKHFEEEESNRDSGLLRREGRGKRIT